MSQDTQPTPESHEEVEQAPELLPDDSIQALLEDARNKADEHWNEVLRLRAEMDNLRKRTERDIDNARKYALEKFIESLLGVADSLDLGLKACQEATDLASLKQGTQMMHNQFFQTLERFGVKPIDPLGEPFNPDLHQAIAMQPAEGESNRVIQVLQKGYQLNDRLLRPALVIVSQ
ncbi:MAG: nucleotide exchange factor GrpE [Gammaproteobacteria bacterium]|nr:nucleotide exchange factor GrpE [Gammaproteobacteria bacterium]